MPSNMEDRLKDKFDDDKIANFLIDLYTTEIIEEVSSTIIFPSHYVVEKKTTEHAIVSIERASN